ncbi:MAG: 3-dehydroquinate synthase [Planctomycetales bacterium]|nr:3-dehydroquinate synthase [Planctomycetales bacterium]
METSNSIATREIIVQLRERSYPIHIGHEILSGMPELLNATGESCVHTILLYDENVAAIALRLGKSLERAEYRISSAAIPSGESSKSVERLEEIWRFLLSEHTDRSSVVIAIGGGVVGDLAGFAAATFARGIRLVQVPTTLLSQVDSSVGGKTGINLPGTKNIVGAFWQPSLVVIDTQSLTSLPQREYLSGLAEVVKYGIIMLPELFEFLEHNASRVVGRDREAMVNIVEQSCLCKASVVKEDERETSGRRAILNYGHTFAHAIESVTGYGTLLHGEAVAIGMHMAATLAMFLGRVDQGFVDRQRALLQQLELPIQFPNLSPNKLWHAMQHDKKVEMGKLRFVLPTRLGHVELVQGISQDSVIAAIAASASSEA